MVWCSSVCNHANGKEEHVGASAVILMKKNAQPRVCKIDSKVRAARDNEEWFSPHDAGIPQDDLGEDPGDWPSWWRHIPTRPSLAKEREEVMTPEEWKKVRTTKKSTRWAYLVGANRPKPENVDIYWCCRQSAAEKWTKHWTTPQQTVGAARGKACIMDKIGWERSSQRLEKQRCSLLSDRLRQTTVWRCSTDEPTRGHLQQPSGRRNLAFYVALWPDAGDRLTTLNEYT